MFNTHKMSTLRRVAFAAIAIATATATPAHAAEPHPDLVGSGLQQVLVGSNNSAAAFAAVKNVSTFAVGTTIASIRLQKVSQLNINGHTAYIDTPGSTPITGLGTVKPILPAATKQFGAGLS